MRVVGASIRRVVSTAVAAVIIGLGVPTAALATTQTASSGSVVATFTFQGSPASGFSRLSLEVTRAGQVLYDRPVSSRNCPSGCWPGGGNADSVHVLDVDANGEPEVVLQLYSGGADCCYTDQVFSFDSAANSYVETQRNFFSAVAKLEDLGHDDKFEFVSADGRFAGVFTDNASSGLPVQIFDFAERKFTDVTRHYAALIKQDAARWWGLFQSNLANGVGYIAAWAADEDLLGRESHVSTTLDEQAKKGNLRNLDPQVLPSGRAFIDKLEKFLREHGYVTEEKCSTKPIKTKDKKLDIEGCFTKGERGTYVSTGTVEVDGLQFTPHTGGHVTIDPGVPSLTMSGTGTIKLGAITVWNWSPTPQVTLPLSGTIGLKRNRDIKVFGFPISGSLQASFGDGDLTATGEVSLRVLGEDITANVSVVVDHKGIRSATVSAEGAGEDPRYHELSSCSLNKPPPLGFECASVTNAKGNTYSGLVPKEPSIVHIGPLPVQDVSLSYDRDKHEWSGQGVLSIGDLLPGGTGGVGRVLPSLGLGMSVGTQPFQFNGGSVSDSDLNLRIGPAVLKEIKFELKLHPQFKVSGDADLAVSTGSIEIKGGFDYESGKASGFQLKLHGTVSLETVTIDGFLTYDGRDGERKITLGGSFSRSFGPASATLGLKGGVGDGHFELDGDGQVSAFGQSADGHGVLSDAGVGACAHVSVLFFSGDIGFRHYWDGGTDFNGCDFGGLQTVGIGEAADAAVGRSVNVPVGLAQAEFASVGTTGPPPVTLSGPGGVQLYTPAVADRISITPQGLAVAVSSSKTTYFIVNRPTAGKWTIAPQPGAPAPIRYELAKPLAPLGLVARVRGHGHTRALTWRFAAQPGVRVRFIQRGGTEQTIATASRGSGRRNFTVASGPGGRREVIAVVSVDGLPQRLERLASFQAPRPRLPRVVRASYRVRRRALNVSWTRLRHANYYDVQIRLAHGTLRYRLPGTAPHTTLTLGGRVRVEQVTVVAAVGGLAGPAVQARRTR